MLCTLMHTQVQTQDTLTTHTTDSTHLQHTLSGRQIDQQTRTHTYTRQGIIHEGFSPSAWGVAVLN